ncbi:type I methionyl aminopeptidase [Bartonella sp. DGB1]|uniref:type I methionyl aminopeptidase n=1 Tax=Bartonella sp. DGB1 TaxID=3239807 RepID=UPI0035248563
MVEYINASDYPIKYTGQIRLYTNEDFNKMREVGKIAATCLDEIYNLIKAGITTQDIDDFVMQFAKQHDVIPAPLNYRGFPKSVCTSINHVVCHGIPNDRMLKEGDIINVDVTFIKDGWYGDSSRMYAVGQIKRNAERLLEITHECLMRAIEIIKPDVPINEIGKVIEDYATSQHCSVVRDFCGHGIGKLFHDAPNILHYKNNESDVILREGMIFTIEPMINLGKYGVKVLQDGWTAVTRDRSLSAQYEHTIGVTKDGYEIFTLSPKNIFYTV